MIASRGYFGYYDDPYYSGYTATTRPPETMKEIREAFQLWLDSYLEALGRFQKRDIESVPARIGQPETPGPENLIELHCRSPTNHDYSMTLRK